jgi:putative membrane protein
MDGYGRVTHFWGGSIVMWVLSLVVIGVLVYSLTQNLHPKQALDTSEDTQLETLKKRYARGEITKDEFEEMKQSL